MTAQSQTAQAHSKIGASGMSRWANCPGSVRLIEGIPQVETEFAKEGSAAHELAERLLIGLTPRKPDPQMLEAVMVYVNYVQGQIEGNTEFWIEHRFDLGEVHAGLFGTADCVVYDRENETLEVIDYKHGAGVAVEVEGNLQLQYYAMGALNSLKLNPKTIKLTVVQPRLSHPDGEIRSWSIHPMELTVDFKKKLIEAAKATEKSDAPLKPGSWCKFCPGKVKCPELERQSMELAKIEFSPASDYDPEKLSRALSFLPQMESWIKAVREFAYSEAMAGKKIPGFKLVAKRAVRKWNDEEAVREWLLFNRGLSMPQIEETKLRSPAQIEKLIAKPERKKLADFVTKVSNGETLTPESDRRKEVIVGPEAEFKKIE